ncbi:MAG: branched-chain amino acid transport system permease protein livM [Frankiaceae bacterium]|nr:branched-chain amino acid transport system permease protein livM [Frankiaceae bacterium]
MDLVLLGLTIGMANALLAVGLVLIYMSNRVVNFAHGEIGAFAVAMMLSLTQVAHWNYWLALPASLAATALLAAVIERTVIQRLFRSPRLIVLIATVGVAQVVTVGRLVLPKPKVGKESIFAGGGETFPVPLNWPRFTFGRVVVQPQHVMVLVAGPLVVLAVVWFLRRSVYGVAIRASAENSSRAQLLGIPVRRVSTLAWVVGALLAGIGSILLAPVVGFSSTEAVGLPLLARGLAAATVARFESIGLAFGVGLAFGLVDQLAIFYTGQAGVTDAVVLGLVLVVLLARRFERRRTTAAEESSWAAADAVRPLPPEVLAHPRWRLVSRTATAVAAGALLAAPLVLKSSTTFLLATIAVVSVVTLAVTILSGWAGQLSLGHWALAGFGGVIGSRLVEVHGLPFWLAFVVAGALGGLVALLLGIPALRLPGPLLAVVTLGFAVVASSWLFDEPWFRGTGVLNRPEWIGVDQFYFIALAFLAVCVFAVRTLQRARFGRNLTAIRDNPVQAAALGVAVVRTKLTAFVVSGTLASLAGFLYSAGVRSAGPEAFPAWRSLSLLAAAIIGGLGSVGGALLGTAYFLGIPYFASGISPYFGILSTGVGLLTLVLVLPGGLARVAFAIRDVVARAVTGIDVRPKVVPVEPALPAPTKTLAEVAS